MCPPDFFDIEYSINPWMDVHKKADGTQSTQWKKLYETYKSLGYEVKLMEPVKGLPDLVFVDAGVLYKNIFIPSNFRYPERQGESIHFENWFRKNGYQIINIDKEFYFEGHGDSLHTGENRIFFGYGFRSSVEAHYEISKVLEPHGNPDIVPVELIDERFYHLDTCFCPIDSENALFFPKGISAKSIKLLEKKINLIPINEDDATKFSCNATIIDKNFVMPEGGEQTREIMESRGFQVYEVPMSQFMKAGGACKCLSMLVG